MVLVPFFFDYTLVQKGMNIKTESEEICPGALRTLGVVTAYRIDLHKMGNKPPKVVSGHTA